MNQTRSVVVEVDHDLIERLADLAGNLQQSADSIVNRVLREYLDREPRLGDPGDLRGSRASYLELTAREELRDLF
jgi:hypothetical protein